MALRLTTTAASDTSADWQPAGETIIQGVRGATGNPLVEIEARVDAAAPWTALTSIYLRNEPFVRVAQLPYLRVKVRGNTAGETVAVFDNE